MNVINRITLTALLGARCAHAQLDMETLGQPPVDTWPTYHGDYTGQHYSTLKQIRQRNVRDLGLVWQYRLNKSEQGAIVGGAVETPVPIRLGPGALAGGQIKATPLFIDGVLYFSAPDHAWAVDARSGREVWHYFWKTSGGEYIGNRGMAMYGDWVYFGTPDGHLVSLEARTGRERWHVQIGDVRLNYYVSAAPVVVGDKLIVGVSGDALDVAGWVEARDPTTGDPIWKWFTTPRAGEPGADTWPSDFAREHGGGMAWQPVTYDPELDLIYVSVGNPNPMYAPEVRTGDNLYSCSVVAIDPNTGEMVWYYQTSSNEAWDFDGNQVPILVDAEIDGEMRKLVIQATRNGMYFLLDRATGEHIVSSVLAESVNWHTGFNANGQPIRNPQKLNQDGGALISPSNGGVQNWTPPAFLPATGLLYINAMQGFDVHYTYGEPDPVTGERGHRAQSVGGYDLSLRAIDITNGEAKWIHRYAGSEWDPPRPHLVGGLLATAGELVFSGAPAGGPRDGGFMVAYDPSNGRQLWHAILPARPSNTPITYMMDGRQYLVFAADDTLYAYALLR
jgi:acido-empty-quinoprotein group A